MTGTLVEDLTTRMRVRRAKPGRGTRALVWQPEARGDGSARRGQQMLGGLWHLAGQVVEAPGTSPWDLETPSEPFAMQLHGQGWLDDLIAVGERGAVARAQTWSADWARRYGTGRGPGWAPALAGRRLLRWIGHAPVLLSGMGGADQTAWFEAAYAQAGYLARHAETAPEGLPRMEALTGLLHASMAFEGLETLTDRAARALANAAARDVDASGGIASRNPEALLEVATLIGLALEALSGHGPAPWSLIKAQERIVPTLRALRHADGALPRFHGGGRGRAGRLERLLTTSGIGARNDDGIAMGFVPLGHGRTTLVADAAAPPSGPVSGSAGASTLAFELTSGEAPVVVNCGPGGAFGPDWHRAGRATASHSTLSLDAHASARIGALLEVDGRKIAPLVQGPNEVLWQRSASRRASRVVMAHDGYGPVFGLTHLRRLVLSTDGRKLEGEDSIRAISAADKERFEDARMATGMSGIPFRIRFHLHPDTGAELDMGGRAVSLTLHTGEVWVFRPGREMELSLEPSVYLEPGRVTPRPSRQVVLSDRVVQYAATTDWSLTLAQDAAEPSPATEDS
ncbi:MAG: heparinase II/III family protein [Pseudomonadota bacterium]